MILVDKLNTWLNVESLSFDNAQPNIINTISYYFLFSLSHEVRIRRSIIYSVVETTIRRTTHNRNCLTERFFFLASSFSFLISHFSESHNNIDSNGTFFPNFFLSPSSPSSQFLQEKTIDQFIHFFFSSV